MSYQKHSDLKPLTDHIEKLGWLTTRRTKKKKKISVRIHDVRLMAGKYLPKTRPILTSVWGKVELNL